MNQLHTDKVQSLFASIASRYDLINDVQSLGLHRRWKQRVVDLASVRPGDRALDICCGTGDIAFELAGRGARVMGLDLCGPMLAIAGRRGESVMRSRPVGYIAPQFILGNAMTLPFPDESFEVVTAGYGLRNLADWQKGLREMQRVAAPGARLVVLDFGRPRNPVWRGIYMAYLQWIVPILGMVLCGNLQAYAYIHASVSHYPAQQGLEEAMREIELQEVETIHLFGGAMTITRAVNTDKPGFAT